VLSLIENASASIGWAERQFTDVRIGDRMLAAVGDPSALALLVWLHRDTLIERIEREIDLVADDQHALTSAQRVEQLKPIEKDRLAVEREEEVLISAAIAEGNMMLRRGDADPRAVLGLDDASPAPHT
jgi:class 3 adenylate cyclase